MDVSAAARALKRGEIVGVPTDTVYGIAVDPYDEAALDKLYDIKGREQGKPIAILVASLEQALAGDEVESRLGLLASMATEAVFFEKTANLGGEDLLTFRHVLRVCRRDGRRGKGQGQ